MPTGAELEAKRQEWRAAQETIVRIGGHTAGLHVHVGRPHVAAGEEAHQIQVFEQPGGRRVRVCGRYTALVEPLRVQCDAPHVEPRVVGVVVLLPEGGLRVVHPPKVPAVLGIGVAGRNAVRAGCVLHRLAELLGGLDFGPDEGFEHLIVRPSTALDRTGERPPYACGTDSQERIDIDHSCFAACELQFATD